ncbi:MAG: signal recognition particle receptor subunit alpha, partial [Chloroflexi bacterium]|nr:signal recognition particle receptor subunit alpha [Chloroflexota bacterium]
MLNFLRRRDTDAENTKRATEKTRRGLLGRVASIFRDSDLDEEAWEELEEILISADVGVESTMELVDRLREERPSTPEEAFDILKREMAEMLSVEDPGHPLDVDARPLVLLVVGVNGVGKTTSIAKLSNLYLQDGQQVLIGAADTFRAGATEQLRTWGRRLEVDVISHREGADPGAVAFDTVSAALSRDADVVIVDTAGRLHTKTNLMEELKKISRVVARHVPESSIRVLLALDAVTGQNGLHQARAF